MATKEMASGRKTFSPETKAEALRLINEEGYTLQQAADQIGCNVNSIQNWRAVAQSGKSKSAKKTKSAKRIKKLRRRRKGVAASAVGTAATGEPPITFEEFVQGYWSQHKDAVEVLQLPPDIAPKAVQYVNKVLRYAYDQFTGQ